MHLQALLAHPAMKRTYVALVSNTGSHSRETQAPGFLWLQVECALIMHAGHIHTAPLGLVGVRLVMFGSC